ncbi:S41 family peptidase [Odoribacter lunatus]|uniref:S41 family peptidase n=1 Tax=Odoribacter lunatus TaxID=2941335 RepID=UPI0020407811|nr:S41 family peptidase [Odoribacter lunatus]
MYKKNIQTILMPTIVALAVVIGMFINSLFIRRDTRDRQELFLPIQGSKVDMVVNMLKHSYVDTVDIKKIEETAVEALIKDLDPHTVYIPAEDLEKVNEDMVGNFGGIGVQFYKYQDTVTIIKVVEGGPSEAAGIKDGDRIIQVNDTVIAGVKMNDAKIMSMMRGQLGTDVTLTLLRRGEKPMVKKVTRGAIPVKSVEVAYMVNDTTGYVKVKTFGMNTYNEFMQAVEGLQKQGMTKLIVDLRNNEGGILPIALKMVNEFLEANKLILYTQGKASPRSDYYSNGKGHFKDLQLSVLINEISASASEIFAGAIQDNDRGTIVGRRSFGKGLVQEQRMLPDGSALRLTVARYYIPSGRSIQRPYDEGKEKYYKDFYLRAEHGELEERDSIHFDENLKYETVGGRTVYGGGGIMPDVFVPTDTVGYSRYLAELSRSMKLYEYTFDFMDRHREEIRQIKDYKELLDYLRQYNLVGEMVDYAAKRGVKKDAKGLKISYKVLENQIQAYIGRHVLNDEGFYPIFGMMDATLQEALK